MDIEFTRLTKLAFNLEESMGSPAMQAEELCSAVILQCLNNTTNRAKMPDVLPRPIRGAFTGWVMLMCCLSQSE